MIHIADLRKNRLFDPFSGRYTLRSWSIRDRRHENPRGRGHSRGEADEIPAGSAPVGRQVQVLGPGGVRPEQPGRAHGRDPSPGNRGRGERGWKQRLWDLLPAREEPGRPRRAIAGHRTVWIRWHADGSFHFVTLKPWRNPRP